MNALHLEGWTVLDTIQTAKTHRFRARYEPRPDHCLKCGSVRVPHQHDNQTVEYVDAPLFGLPTTIEVETGRYKCLDCGGTFMQPLPDMQPKRRLTRRCVDFIADRTGNQTWAKTARDLGIDEKTVREIGFEYLAIIGPLYKPYAPRILGVDELTLSGHLRVMLVDIDRKQPIDILNTFSKAAVVRWLMWLPNRHLIQMVSMDMSSMFHGAISSALPGVPIIADKFHVVRCATGALNTVRIAKGKKDGGAKKKITFKSRKALLKRPSKLTAKQAFALDGMLLNDPDLKEAYDCKERFFKIWDARTREAAEKAIDAWLEAVPPQHEKAFKHAITALEEWREEVLEGWGEYPFVSNAYTEATNGMAKIHNRTGRGYQFEVIRARILLDLRKITPDAMIRCDECGVRFAAGMLVAQEEATTGRGRRKKHFTFCPNCTVNKRPGHPFRSAHPTLQSG